MVHKPNACWFEAPSSGHSAQFVSTRARSTLLVCFSLVVLTLAAYWPVRNHDFIYYDDPQFITENPQIQSGLSLKTVRYAFSTAVVGNWHPVTTLSHALDCQVFGVNPRAHHLVNVLLHSLNAALLFLLLQGLTAATWRSALVAVIFALHPLRVESVAWVAERKDLLSGLFFILSVWAYTAFARKARYFKTPNSGQSLIRSSREKNQEHQEPQVLLPGTFLPAWFWYLLALLCFIFGLMSKPMVVTLPFVLLLLDYWPLHRLGSTNPLSATRKLVRLVWEKTPFFVLSLAGCLITLSVQKSVGATQVVRRATLLERFANAVTSYLQYLGDLVWPARLAIVYPHPARHYYLSEQWPAWEITLGVVLLILISILAWCQLSRRPYFAVGWFWFSGMIVPVIGLVQAGEQAMADRYTYLPLIGPVISLVWWLTDGFRNRLHGPKPWLAGAFLLMAALFASTRHQLQYWRNTLTLFEHAVEVTADNPTAQFGVGMGLLEQDRVAQAMVRFRVALAIDPSYVRAHYIMGQLLRMQGHLEAAAAEYEAAVRLNPSDVGARINLAGLLPLLGRGHEAYRQLEEALRLEPDSLGAMNNLAWLLATSVEPDLRDGARAVRLAERACASTGFKQAAFIGTLAAAYAEAGRFPEAAAMAQRAVAAAEASGDTELASRNQSLLTLYRAGKPYREGNQTQSERPTKP